MRPNESGTTRVSMSRTIASLNDLRIFVTRSSADSITFDTIRKRSKPCFIPFFKMDVELFMRTYIELRSKIDNHKLKLKKLHERIADFQNAGNELRETVEQRLATGAITAEKIRQLNLELLQVESNWLDPDGIPGRPWFQHLLYAARYTYAHLEFPGLTEAVEKRDWKLASDQAALVQRALEKNIELLRKAKISWEKNN